ncbi:MAG: 23S rRNA (pseudouridine(1915)-N(3))-methyltransferase RlmH [Oscillospiraceae bacterium]|nr:23S rRNA (pseudouridine(1915)-N(3))-methyltransferase RlmH [Oscillospiraceae bacterium]
MFVQLLTVGKQKEPHLISAQEIYAKRLTPFCKFQFTQLPAIKISDKPSEKEIQKALAQESDLIQKNSKGILIALCIEGKQFSSQDFSKLLTQDLPMRDSAVTFVIGSSFGLHESIKKIAFQKLSMSDMTFPHALASVMLMEQIYRAYQIANHTSYHK